MYLYDLKAVIKSRVQGVSTGYYSSDTQLLLLEPNIIRGC